MNLIQYIYMFATESYRNCLEIQRLLVDDIRQASPKERPALVKAFDTILERKRILRMKPLPKAVDVTQMPRRMRAAAIAEHIELAELEPSKESLSEPDRDHPVPPPTP